MNHGHHHNEVPVHLPPTAIDRWLRPLRTFLQIEAAGGVVLVVCTLVALALTNSPWSASFLAIWKTTIGFQVGEWQFHESLGHWINDGLMTLFFFVVGLEIKRELVTGELRDPRNAALPVIAAVGGMLVPAAIYWLLQHGQPGARGWAIPTATDIAFVVGLLALLGPRVPLSLKILLLSLAIADDIGAIIVIAVGYSQGVHWTYLFAALAGIGLLLLLRAVGVRRYSVYGIVGVGVWAAILESGIHPTIAGVVIGFLTPTRAWIDTQRLQTALDFMLGATPTGASQSTGFALTYGVSQRLARVMTETISPLTRLEHALHPWVSFLILPLFALANAGVVVKLTALQHPVALATGLGLVVGKPVGILLFSWLAVKLRLARLPTGVSWRVIFAAGCLAGIGFTMSLFIAGLALDEEMLDAAKLGTLLGSAVSATLGFVLLGMFLPKRVEQA